MQMEELDLMTTSCPMALLLAKRALHTLGIHQSLQLSIADSGSRRDILRFLTEQQVVVTIITDTQDKLIIQVSKDNS